MLIGPDGKHKTNLPHDDEFTQRRARLSGEHYQAVVHEINEYCDAHNSVKCAYFASDDWTGTPRESLSIACGGDMEEAAKFLGQILWLVLQERDDEWWFYREQSLEDRVEGMTYVRSDQ